MISWAIGGMYLGTPWNSKSHNFCLCPFLVSLLCELLCDKYYGWGLKLSEPFFTGQDVGIAWRHRTQNI